MFEEAHVFLYTGWPLKIQVKFPVFSSTFSSTFSQFSSIFLKEFPVFSTNFQYEARTKIQYNQVILEN